MRPAFAQGDTNQDGDRASDAPTRSLCATKQDRPANQDHANPSPELERQAESGRRPDQFATCCRSLCVLGEGLRRSSAALRLWHVASLDAPTVALVWSCAFAWSVHVSLPLWAPLLLALAAWAIYIGDRLLDAYAGTSNPPRHRMRERHYFHWRHRRALATLALAAAITCIWIVITRLPAGARVPDSAIAAATLVYFSGVHSRRKLPATHPLSPDFPRACAIGILFTAGCLLPTLSQSLPSGGSSSTLDRMIIPALFFAAVGWLNCHAIGHWESLSLNSHPRALERSATAICVAGSLLAMGLARSEPRLALLVAAGSTSAAGLALLGRQRTRISDVSLRASADLVLLIPLVLLALEHFRA